ncbi:hypothetical protein ACFZCL_34930 [Streptomyces sp. NPDC008159]
MAVHSRPADEKTATRQINAITALVDHAVCAQPHRREGKAHRGSR